ncbi:glutamate transport system ATP-binding protein [Kitasatospora sp. GP30]|uniref:amino acid ABC transporter ATP-binding protein n=1 Tax=Kitasatospora sp. GP30 TaxID=3035084 RepID=UPI002474EF39|nr:amino acid ABC transporter ATP-binding protein [Kitasatospora sp. GP30]MDH6144771.1 glutamate transport system ATP-binding protein [Kitasatospora sp. GP30]
MSVASGPGSAARADALLQLRGVNKHYGQSHVLRDVDLDVHAGEVVVLLGASGSGKSTLCRCVNRLETIDSGEIVLDGTPIPAEGRELARLRAQVGMVFQSFNLFGHRTVLENVTLAPVRVRGLPRGRAEERARELLDRVGLADKADAHPAQLSGGQQQRVAIARTLAMDPRLILFDEPTSALDPEMIGEVLEVMTELAAEGMTMLVVTHEMGFARRAADRVAFLDQGRILETAPPDVFFENPSTDRARDFLGKILRH